jgi:Organic solute transporter Ostalpha
MISSVVAIISILRFYTRSKAVLKPRGTFKQLICLKLFVFLNFIQTVNLTPCAFDPIHLTPTLKFVFNFLTSGGHLHPTTHLTFDDLSRGLPSLLLSCEVALFSPFFLYAYTCSPYIVRRGTPANCTSPQGYYGGPSGVHAILSAINVVDIVAEFVQGIKARAGGTGRGVGNYASMIDDGRSFYHGSAGRQEYSNSTRLLAGDARMGDNFEMADHRR